MATVSKIPPLATNIFRLSPHIRLNSLAARLIAAATVWTMLALAVGGVVLSGAFRSAVLDNFDSRLSGDMDGLIAAAQPDENGGVVLQDRFVNHEFDRVYSGLYYQIKPAAAGQPATVGATRLRGCRCGRGASRWQRPHR